VVYNSRAVFVDADLAWDVGASGRSAARAYFLFPHPF
jgi:hypothetical protein